MNFKLDEGIELLERTPDTLKSLLSGLSDGWLTCNEGEGTWNALEVVGHLIEAEKVNWIPRIKMILTKGESQTFPDFDRFAHIEQVKGKTIDELLREFKQVRNESLEELRTLITSQTDYELKGTHPVYGTVKLRELLSTWSVHDLTHITQITRVIAKRYHDDVGSWKEYLSILK
ncbi:DinB family protein [Bacillus sp. NEB1478]|uniref:DinB family protein n=1 Tax=Bacillus sp. NEB1478 TaxID=3073816 RepID=UPI002872F6B0|nr:DinB family protein [Bacillus sp. NEB1478]WNB91174.1 DinB family protein [Bacillus sp. NEB1478]